MRLCLFLFCAFELMAGTIVKETCPGGFWLEAHINNDLRITELAFSDTSRICYEYEDNKLYRIVRYDALSRESYSQTYDWDESKLISQTGWFTTRYVYDEDHRVIEKINPWYQATIEYDPAGNATRIGNRIYSYDALGQITAEQGCFQAVYDGACNLVELNGEAIAVDEHNKIAGYNYDALGNLLKDGFVFDNDNCLIEACGERYFYDSYGRLIQKGNTCYLYLGCEEIASFENGQCKTLKIPGIGGPIAIEIDGRPYAPVVDAQGIIRKLIDPVTDSVYRENNCDIFGGGLTDTVPYAYRGKRYDLLTGLIYFGRRYYDPSLHRWLTPDPLGPIDHENLYQYVYNNPLRYWDPTGASFWGYALGLGEIVAGSAIMVGGVGLEFATLGGFTFGFTFVEGAGFALMADGLTRATFESRDMRLPKWDKDNNNLLSQRDSTAPSLPDAVEKRNKPGSVDETLPTNPDDLLKQPGWKETTHPEAGAKGRRTFENTQSGAKLEFDKGKPGETGHKAKDHYHRPNPNSKSGKDKYLDAKGNPVPNYSDRSHLYPKQKSAE